MNPKILQKSKGRGTDGHLLECVWQMEFYHASMQILPEDTYASVDALNQRLEHQQGFEEGGIYVPILKHADKWALIDIHNSGMDYSEPEQHKKHDIYVLCTENFESVQLIYPDGSEESVQLLGEEEDLLGYDISDFLNDPMETD
ncbi:6646_t:CDS:2 [Entrophospora sp. SA101]|nr:10659_t:CDS:2 [Entrophospora sp. SA101]CAJ0748290.1 4990_t:CDS:2 [Entrophospora sp. SA101]CAJ0751694.1 6646_t:CDS:2 [Entrophospora sp. SA101]CAJ0823645.1 3527_t:CDS:2 [Entrophospora sp. SA101]CAJ0833082.1 9970_t:CDS:2 [Entrophospora sp. SA101]